jgi:hypothetical protein
LVNDKKILNAKDKNAYNYNFIFDDLMTKYAKLEEELDINELRSIEKIIFKITIQEDFTKLNSKHNIYTTYLFSLTNL